MGRTPNLPKNWLAVAMALNEGKIEGCAEALRVACGNPSRTTVYRWAKGLRNPANTAKAILNRLFVENGQEMPYPDADA